MGMEGNRSGGGKCQGITEHDIRRVKRRLDARAPTVTEFKASGEVTRDTVGLSFADFLSKYFAADAGWAIGVLVGAGVPLARSTLSIDGRPPALVDNNRDAVIGAIRALEGRLVDGS